MAKRRGILVLLAGLSGCAGVLKERREFLVSIQNQTSEKFMLNVKMWLGMNQIFDEDYMVGPEEQIKDDTYGKFPMGENPVLRIEVTKKIDGKTITGENQWKVAGECDKRVSISMTPAAPGPTPTKGCVE